MQISSVNLRVLCDTHVDSYTQFSAMKDREGSPRDSLQKPTAESSEKEDDDEQPFTSAQRRDNVTATKVQASQYFVAESHKDEPDTPSVLLREEPRGIVANGINTGRQNDDGSVVCIEKHPSTLDHVGDRRRTHEPLENTTTQSFSCSHNIVKREEDDRTRSLEAADSIYLEGGGNVRSNLYSKGIMPKNSTSTTRPLSAVREGTQAEGLQPADLHTVYESHEVSSHDRVQAGQDRKQYHPASDEHACPNSHSKVTQDSAFSQGFEETFWETETYQDEHTREVPPCKDRQRNKQLGEEDDCEVLKAADDAQWKNLHNTDDYFTSDANMLYSPGYQSRSSEKLWSPQQSNTFFRSTRFIRSIRNSFTDASEWPRIARLLHFSQLELEGAGLDMSGATAHRNDFPRFTNQLFAEGGRNATQLFPLALFVEAARLQKTQMINGAIFGYSEKLLGLRDTMLCVYLQVQRMYHDRLCDKLPLKNGSRSFPSDRREQHFAQHVDFLRWWFDFEVQYLHEAEKAALQALKPLTDCILTLEALMISEKREAILAPPQDANQRKCTVKYLQAFCAAISQLTKIVLPPNQAEAYHQAELFVVASAIRWKAKTESEAKKRSYATAEKKNSTESDFFGIDYHMHLTFITVSEEEITFHALNDQAVTASHNLMSRFKKLRDFLWARRKCLDHLDPHLNKDFHTVQVLRRFEVACRQFRRRILRPANLV